MGRETAKMFDFKLMHSQKVPVRHGTENPKNKVCVTLDSQQVEIIKSSLNHSISDILVQYIYDYRFSPMSVSDIQELVDSSEEVIARKQILELLCRCKDGVTD